MITLLHRSARLAALALAASVALAGCSETPGGSLPGAELAEGAAIDDDWKVDPNGSYLAYVSIKSGEIAETNKFQKLSGMVAADGAARIEIDLASVNTGVDVRDERMRTIFFEVADFPKALITAQLDPKRFTELDIGTVMVEPLTARLTLKGMEADIDARVQVARVSENRVIATTTEPVLITTDMFGLTDELGTLRALAELPSISPAVPVTFSFAFIR
ncbi:MAG: YceI family protein [Erythrobacter sp.]